MTAFSDLEWDPRICPREYPSGRVCGSVLCFSAHEPGKPPLGAGFQAGWQRDATGVYQRVGAARRRKAAALGLREPPATRRGFILAAGVRRRSPSAAPFPVTVRCDRCRRVTTFTA